MYKNSMKTFISFKNCLGIDKPSRVYHLMGTPAINPNPSGAGTTVIGTITANQGTANATPWNENIAQFGGTNVTLGQKVMTSSMPVTIASDQSGVPVTGTFWQATQPVSGTVTANAGTGTFNIQANASVNVAQINGITPLMGNGTTGTGSQRVTIASDNTAFAVNATLSAETTKVIGTVNQGTSPWVTNATLQTQTDTVMVGGVNVKEINAVTPLMGNGVTGTGSLRVTIASDNTAFAVNATLSAETTKVIGTVNQGTSPWIVAGGGTAGTAATGVVTVQGIAGMTKLLVTPDSVALPANQSVNVAQIAGSTTSTAATGTQLIGIADGAGNKLTTNSTTYTSKFALDSNLLGTLGTAFSTAGKVDVKAADGDVFVRQATSSNLNADINLKSVAGTGIVNGGVAGSQSVGGTVATNVAITANPLNLGAQAVSSENTAVTTARQVQLVADLVGKLIVLPYANPENFVSGRATATDTTSTSLIAAPAAGLRNYITQITVWNSSATNTYIKIQDGSGGTELYDIPAPTLGGATLTLPTPLRQPTTATAIYFAANASANAVFISASGYKGV